MTDSNSSSVPQIFVPLVRPRLEETPSQAEAATFLRSYERYVEEAAHLRRNGEGNGREADPISFCIDANLLEFLVEYEVQGIEIEDGVATEASLLAWLKGIRGTEDGRTLAEVMRGIRWPAAVVGQTLPHQTMIFMKLCHVALHQGNYKTDIVALYF